MTMQDKIHLCHHCGLDERTVHNMHKIIVPWLEREAQSLRDLLQYDHRRDEIRAEISDIEAAMAVFESRVSCLTAS